MKNVIFQTHIFRIFEVADINPNLGDLMGDMFCPKANPDISPSQLEHEAREFIERDENEGVFGYVLEYWNPDLGCGWTHLDSCYGFVGQYSDTNQHYIVEEMKETIKTKRGA